MKKWTNKQLEILYECWKSADNNKDRLELIKKKLPKVHPVVALSEMRKKAKNDTKWIKMATRKKNQKEKEKEEKKKVRVKREKEKEERKKVREEKRKQKKILLKQQERDDKIKESLNSSHENLLVENLDLNFFFCPATNQYVHELSCIFRVFSNEYDVNVNSTCEKCVRMNKYIDTLLEVINEKESRRDKAGKRRSQNKKQN